MADERLGPVQQTLLITLYARARAARRRRPALRDPKAVELVESVDIDLKRYGRGAGGPVVILRTATIDSWVRAFLADHPQGTVVELGCGLSTRFDRLDNGTVHWFDVDLPDTIELRRRFFTDTDRRRMVAASVLSDDWQDAVSASQGPYFFVAEGVLVYLPEADVLRALRGMAERFPGALASVDTYPARSVRQQHTMADRRGIEARWAWSCDDPRAFADRAGLEVLATGSLFDPPAQVRAALPPGYRLTLPVLTAVFRGFGALSLLRLP